jgi:hypothetical protein
MNAAPSGGPKRQRRRKNAMSCCEPWQQLTNTERETWAAQALHQFAHSRVPFTVDWYADIARLGREPALRRIGWAEQMDWIAVAGPGLYVGRLAKGR